MEQGKKRKRYTDVSSKTSKKVVVEEERDVTVSLQETNEWLPFVGMHILNNPDLQLQSQWSLTSSSVNTWYSFPAIDSFPAVYKTPRGNLAKTT